MLAQKIDRPPIFLRSRPIAVGHLHDAAQIEIVFQVGHLHSPPDGIQGSASNEVLIGLSAAMRYGFQRPEDRLAETFRTKAVERPLRIFDHVMKNRDRALLRTFQPQHHSKRVKDVRSARFVHLAGMCFGGNGNGPFESRHYFKS